MATIDDIITRAEGIRDETAIGANTATRVGGVMVDTAEHVSDVEDALFTDKAIDIVSSMSVINGEYIKNTAGEIASLAVYSLLWVSVNEGETYTIRVTNASGTARAYAVYSTDDPTLFGTATKLAVGGSMTRGDYTDTITIPSGGKSLVVTSYSGAGFTIAVETMTKQSIRDEFDEFKDEVDDEIADIQTSLVSVRGEVCASVSADGTKLYVAYLANGSSVEWCYEFRKCMANDLMTFYHVGYRTVSRSYPDTDGISGGDGITYVNITSSDNIGPIWTNDGGWAGGNHTYDNVLTAETDSFGFHADGKLLSASDTVYCKSVEVIVTNTIYDPAVPPQEGDTILSSPLSTETAIYTIRKNTIEVSVRQKFASTTTNTIKAYYGMQSMFQTENYIMTPNGAYPSWTAADNGMKFQKSGYPDFNLFAEKSTTKSAYQGTYLYRNKLGNHGQIASTDDIFSRNSSKGYHHIMNNVADIADKTYAWSGGYTFVHDAIQDDADIFAYRGTYNGMDAVFIIAQNATEQDIALPSDLLLRKMIVVEQSATLSTDNVFTDACGVSISASGAGLLIFALE